MKIVALSDQHGHLPEIPPCDLLIVAGDICPDRIGRYYAMREPRQQQAWLDRTWRPWIAKAPATHKIATWGNHDWCGQAATFAADDPAHAPTTKVQIVVDEMTRVPDGRGRPLTIWATPWSNEFMRWAFMKSPRDLEAIYAAIPEGIDILVSHQPPFGYGDTVASVPQHLGSHELLATIERVRPRLVICGHFHEGRGRYEHKGTIIYNVAVVNDQYELVHPATEIEL